MYVEHWQKNLLAKNPTSVQRGVDLFLIQLFQKVFCFRNQEFLPESGLLVCIWGTRAKNLMQVNSRDPITWSKIPKVPPFLFPMTWWWLEYFALESIPSYFLYHGSCLLHKTPDMDTIPHTSRCKSLGEHYVFPRPHWLNDCWGNETDNATKFQMNVFLWDE